MVSASDLFDEGLKSKATHEVSNEGLKLETETLHLTNLPQLNDREPEPSTSTP